MWYIVEIIDASKRTITIHGYMITLKQKYRYITLLQIQWNTDYPTTRIIWQFEFARFRSPPLFVYFISHVLSDNTGVRRHYSLGPLPCRITRVSLYKLFYKHKMDISKQKVHTCWINEGTNSSIRNRPLKRKQNSAKYRGRCFWLIA